MKKILTAFIPVILLASCSSDDAPTPEPINPDPVILAEKHWIPNWTKDTLYCILPALGAKDTLFSYKSGDTSMIRYKGVAYYIWTIANPYENNAKTYNNCYISLKPFDLENPLAGHILFTVEPGSYLSEYTGRLEAQEQAVEDRGLYTFPAPPFHEDIKSFSTKYKSW